MHSYRYLLLLIGLLWINPVKGQLIKTKSYEFNLGFYLGRPAYWGDYNGGLFGGATQYSNGKTPQKTWGTDISFGAAAWIPLKWGLSLKPTLEYGTLNYGISDIFQPYYMKTPYRAVSLGLQYDLDFGMAFNPYISSGVELFDFVVPDKNSIPEFQFESKLSPYQRDETISVPVTIGFNYDVGDFSSVFMESTLRFTQTDKLDNYEPTVSKFNFKNDMVFSWQAGIRVQVINIIKFIFNPPKSKPLLAYDSPQVDIRWEPKLPLLDPVPTRGTLAPPITDISPDVTTTTAAPPIPVVSVDNRTFNKDEALVLVENLQKEKAEQPGEEKPNRNLDWDPTVPIIQSGVSTIPSEILEHGFVTDTAPEGYYVQTYATVGPISATRVRQRLIVATTKQNLLADPEKQIFIMKRKQFYEVRIGVFDSYEQTLRVLEAMQGIFLDSYSLIYLPNNQ